MPNQAAVAAVTDTMKKNYLAIGLLAINLLAQAQSPDSTFKKRIVPKTQIEAVFSSYVQDGNHSAVTGGIGTEALVVIAPSLNIVHNWRGYNTIHYHGGADFITSASTDNIDHILSSASRKDTRGYSDLSYTRALHKTDLSITAGTGFSIESDYFSVPASLGLHYREPSQMRSYDLSFQVFFDDLRWGRLNPGYFRAVKLIYPDELRYKDWFTITHRNSYNLKFAFTQVLNRRMTLTFMPEFTIQQGLLSTPFHRVYFTDGTERVENLPMQRIKVPLALRWQYFAGRRTIIKAQYSFYWDDWGIISHGIELETAIKVTPVFTLSPFFRFYHQVGSRYFKPFQQHSAVGNFYTCDYDLATMQTYKAGLGLRYAPYHYVGKRFQFQALNLRYAFYAQSNGLQAHAVSLIFELAASGK